MDGESVHGEGVFNPSPEEDDGMKLHDHQPSACRKAGQDGVGASGRVLVMENMLGSVALAFSESKTESVRGSGQGSNGM